MALRLFAFFTGLGYAILGILVFITQVLWDPARPRVRQLEIGFGHGYLGGFLPVNIPHNILWIVIGVGGIVASLNRLSARTFARGLFVFATCLAIVGFIPLGVSTLWGVLPLDGWNVLIHAWTAILAWYFGYVYAYAPWQTVTQ